MTEHKMNRVRNILLLIIIMVFTEACKSNNKKLNIHKEYCFEDSYHDMMIEFKMNEDTIYMYYVNVLDGGKYINSYNDSTDYAISFTSNDLKNNKINLDVKNYYTGSYSNIDLTFKDNESIIWQSLDELTSYLPEKAHFTKCKNK